jgi:excisionase family DNA binding protein
VKAVHDRLLTYEEAAAMLNTKPRFARRLVTERRIRFTRVGRHVRIPESAVREFIEAGMVDPIQVRWRAGKAVA